MFPAMTRAARTLTTLLSKTASRRTAVAAGTLALAAAAAPLMGAGPWGWGWHREPVVVIHTAPPPRAVIVQPAPTVVVVPAGDQIPSDLRFAAYQSRDTVIILASGVNPYGGFSTSLTAADVNAPSPTIVMHNVATTAPVAGAPAAAFSFSAALHTNRPLTSVTVLLGGAQYQVAVTETPALN